LLAATAGCAGGGGSGLLPSKKAADTPVETFAYQQASDRALSVKVTQTLTFRDKDFLPNDRNWLQMELSVANVGKRPVQITDVRAKLAGGEVIASAANISDLAKPPSLTGQTAKSMGINAAGQMAGMMLFPPLALIAGTAGLFSSFGGADRLGKKMKTIEGRSLQKQSLAPGTSASGLVFVPAVRGQTALMLFYTVDGRTEVVTVPRAS
jgi:hypothetical protein